MKKKKLIGFTVFFFCCFIALQNISANVLKVDLEIMQELTKSEKPAIIIKGILVDKEGNPLAKKEMLLYLANRPTTLDTKDDEPKKSGLGKQIEGSGTLALRVEGVESGGSLKLIDGRTVNPYAETDENGYFKFDLSAKFIEGENEVLITVDYNDYNGTKSYPIVDAKGNPIFLKISKDKKVIELGKVMMMEIK